MGREKPCPPPGLPGSNRPRRLSPPQEFFLRRRIESSVGPRSRTPAEPAPTPDTPMKFLPTRLVLLLALLGVDRPAPAAEALPRIGVYATAGDVERYLVPPDKRAEVLERLRPLDVTRVFVEGRRGDEYVAPDRLREVRSHLATLGIEATGGIATVPGSRFGTRQQGPLGWLNWESPETRDAVASFFRENAPVFDDLIVDDFYCTGDVSPASELARGSRSWGEYRRDLLVSALDPLIFEPARRVRPETRLIMKFPQWYDRFHLFGYDPARMAPRFSAVWVGTEVRDPLTRRMGFVQPTEGYINFRWIRELAGPRVVGAWFDHIECSAWNFVDQAYQSVLAGARELTLFRLGDVMERHPGDELLARHLPKLRDLAAKTASRPRRGLTCYKPPNGDPGANLYLMDYLAMLGWPVLPVASYPHEAPAVILGAQAAADPNIVEHLAAGLERGQMIIATTAFLRAAGPRARSLAGVETFPRERPTQLREFRNRHDPIELPRPLDIDAGVRLTDAQWIWQGRVEGEPVPLLTSRVHGRGTMITLAIRTFSDDDFRNTGEWLLAPRELGVVSLPRRAADELRDVILAPLGTSFSAPPGVALHLFEGASCLHSFSSEPVEIRLHGKPTTLAAHECRWFVAD